MTIEASTPPSRTCPKCGTPCGLMEVACSRCGLLSELFDKFAAEGDPAGLDAAWADCEHEWARVDLHDHVLDVATRLHCLPALARRYRARLAGGEDPIAEKRLQQIAILIETATRMQAREDHPHHLSRAIRVAGNIAALLLLIATAWVLVIAWRRH